MQTEAFAGTRLALVLGNSNYQAVPALGNPANDAADLAQTLRSVGFEVIEQRDATRDAMARAVRDFSERLRGADVALFFYAGHGLQMNGENYLLPVDAKIETPADVRFNTLNLTDIQQEMEGTGRANIIILDACRNNPFVEKLAHGGRATPNRGLGRIEAAGQGSLIVYSTQPNNIALDGVGRNSPFTAALLKHIATPGIEVRQMLSRVRGDVLQTTGQKQTPWDSSSLVGDVYLAAQPTPIGIVASPATPTQSAASSQAPGDLKQPALVATQAAPSVEPRTAASQVPPVTADGPVGECERAAAPPPPFASPQQLKIYNTLDFSAAVPICEAAMRTSPNELRLEFLLGHAYEKTRNYMEALRHLTKAADAGYAPAQARLGILFATGRGVVKDRPRAFELFSKAAAAGVPGAISNLGAMYSNGEFVKKDEPRALELYEKAIEAGDPFALTQTGLMYFYGKGTPRDYNAAAQYFQQAADLNDGFSLKYLAVMYERGLLGAPDPLKAAELRRMAVQVDPTSQDPNVPPPQKTVRPQHASRVHYVRRIYRYRFFGCSWVWC
ncbi:caspase family protein [Bradyrhizobium prioriisuperbiae]|uniref:caspase family protein n=1 Tax=Bradyrhizobium prioriisuperbiae TaxID=2854389 RepID=UPI0028E730F9|nr:caspase family protein [Bradyrhizobium prioritasuperba]